MISAAQILHTAVAAVCPITGVSVGRVADRATWKFTPTAAATAQQITAATNTLATFDLAGAVTAAIQQGQGISGDSDFLDLFNRLQTATAAQIKSYVQSNVTDLASAKLLLAKVLLLLSMVVRQ